jgi:hypothetical protein
MDTSRRQKIATTEAGVARAIALGLDRPHPIVERARAYLVALLEGRARFPDRPESNDRWETGWKLFTAATLARIDPEHPSLDAHCELWSAVVERTFAGGAYDPDAEALAHAELTGASVRGSYLVLDSKYAVLLLGARAGALPAAIEPLYVSWLCSSPRGLRYMAAPLERPRTAPPSYVDRWLSSLELLAGYPSLGRAGEDAERWLLAQQKAPGVWDLGPRSTQSAALPLSSDWRNASRREADWTARVLCLLAQVRLSQS